MSRSANLRALDSSSASKSSRVVSSGQISEKGETEQSDFSTTRQRISAPREGYKVVFTTVNIAPTEIPDFPYMAVALRRNEVEYEARVFDTERSWALSQIINAWSDASFVSIERDDSSISPQPHAILVQPMGTMPPPPPPVMPSRRQRFRQWLRGWFF